MVLTYASTRKAYHAHDVHAETEVMTVQASYTDFHPIVGQYQSVLNVDALGGPSLPSLKKRFHFHQNYLSGPSK